MGYNSSFCQSLEFRSHFKWNRRHDELGLDASSLSTVILGSFARTTVLVAQQLMYNTASVLRNVEVFLSLQRLDNSLKRDDLEDSLLSSQCYENKICRWKGVDDSLISLYSFILNKGENYFIDTTNPIEYDTVSTLTYRWIPMDTK